MPQDPGIGAGTGGFFASLFNPGLATKSRPAYYAQSKSLGAARGSICARVCRQPRQPKPRLDPPPGSESGPCRSGSAGSGQRLLRGGPDALRPHEQAVRRPQPQ